MKRLVASPENNPRQLCVHTKSFLGHLPQVIDTENVGILAQQQAPSGVSPIHPADCQLKVFLFVFNWSCSCTGYYKHFRIETREEAFLGSFPFTPNWLLQELH